MVGELPTSGLVMLASVVTTPHVTTHLLETMGLRGAILMDFGETIELWRDSTGRVVFLKQYRDPLTAVPIVSSDSSS